MSRLFVLASLLGGGAGVVVPVPQVVSITEVSLFITAGGTFLIGMLSWQVNKRGAKESRVQREAAYELERRSQGFEEMKALARERGMALAEERAENQRLSEENRLLRELTRAQVAIAETHDLLLPAIEDRLPKGRR